MKNMGFLTVLALFAAGFGPSAQAKSFWDWFVTPDVDVVGYTDRPYLYDAKTPHVHTWKDENWIPDGWTAFRGSSEAVINDLYFAGILTEQYEDDGVPVLEVGQRFMDLSVYDQYKVVAYVDDVFGVTETSEDGMIYIRYFRRNEPIGVYTKHGLQLQ